MSRFGLYSDDDDEEATFSTDDDIDLGTPDDIDPEVWQDYWSEELVTLYHDMQEQVNKMGWAILDECSFHDFATFCYQKSSKRPPSDGL